jgi:hypothetical protein
MFGVKQTRIIVIEQADPANQKNGRLQVCVEYSISYGDLVTQTGVLVGSRCRFARAPARCDATWMCQSCRAWRR